jgi:calpain-15
VHWRRPKDFIEADPETGLAEVHVFDDIEPDDII